MSGVMLACQELRRFEICRSAVMTEATTFAAAGGGGGLHVEGCKSVE